MEREDVKAEEVDLNKVAIIANACLAKHKNLFSDFYEQQITPLWRQKTRQETIIAQTAEPLDKKFEEVSNDLTSYIHDPQYSLPEKQGILAMVMGYDDALLKGNLFSDKQFQSVVTSEKKYKETPFLFLVFSYVRNYIVNKSETVLSLNDVVQVEDWTIYVFEKT